MEFKPQETADVITNGWYTNDSYRVEEILKEHLPEEGDIDILDTDSENFQEEINEIIYNLVDDLRINESQLDEVFILCVSDESFHEVANFNLNNMSFFDFKSACVEEELRERFYESIDEFIEKKQEKEISI